MNADSYLRLVAGSRRQDEAAGGPSFSVQLTGLSPVSGLAERVTVITRQLPDAHVIYLLLVAPAAQYAMLAPSSERMVRSLKVSRSATHR